MNPSELRQHVEGFAFDMAGITAGLLYPMLGDKRGLVLVEKLLSLSTAHPATTLADVRALWLGALQLCLAEMATKW